MVQDATVSDLLSQYQLDATAPVVAVMVFSVASCQVKLTIQVLEVNLVGVNLM